LATSTDPGGAIVSDAESADMAPELLAISV
jgi:hypothetical protein